MIEWYKKVVFENYANFKGRARRSEYWYFVLANALISVALIILGGAIGRLFGDGITGVIVGYAFFLLYTLATLIPSLGVVARRLHDVNKSGWFYFVSFIPLVGPIWILILFCTEGDAGSNQYGPDPKNETDQISEIGSVEVQ
ncbi:DUF805 domain-containing protein [Flavobacterium geliluteum]|uniref:DUF805 domain-containing protein n=1 Tax=Flavobacterium geliluteum TaxID=2816120 RepID=A0A940X9D5_9FLAO|nr:DUF805 domain-containing protein [Flavobacterium geliluteum]MBP4138017.1 DUF805 domain-containing protein [Flavobacterium geliluteum]